MSDYDWYKDKHFDEVRKDNYRPGSMGRHEAIHSCYIIQENIDTYLLSHMGVLNNETAWKKIEKAKDLIHEAYNILALEPQKCKFHDLPIGVKFSQEKFRTKLPLTKVIPYRDPQSSMVFVAENYEIRLTALDCVDLDVEEVV